MDKDTDREFVLSFVNGSENAFNDLVRKYQKIIYWHARRMVGNHLDADEITQQVIIVLYKKVSDFKFNSSLRTWIYKITQTRCINLLRKNKVRKIFSLDDAKNFNLTSNQDIVKNFEDIDKLDRVNKILKDIPTKQREVFILRHFDQLSYEEIAEITGKSIGGLKASYYHASKKIFGRFIDEK